MFDVASLGSTCCLWTALGFTVSRHNVGDLIGLHDFRTGPRPPRPPAIVGLRPP
jgi:hypothetical protein